jgi:hypothetical protein
MPRKRVISRNMKVAHVRYLVLNEGNNEVEEREGDYLMGYTSLAGVAQLAKRNTEDGYMFVKLLSTEVESVLYEMPEEDFFKYARKA